MIFLYSEAFILVTNFYQIYFTLKVSAYSHYKGECIWSYCIKMVLSENT